MTSEYYDELAEQIGDNWFELAEALKMNHPTTQRIVQLNKNDVRQSSQSARDVLRQWHRASYKFKVQVSQAVSGRLTDNRIYYLERVQTRAAD